MTKIPTIQLAFLSLLAAIVNSPHSSSLVHHAGHYLKLSDFLLVSQMVNICLPTQECEFPQSQAPPLVHRRPPASVTLLALSQGQLILKKRITYFNSFPYFLSRLLITCTTVKLFMRRFKIRPHLVSLTWDQRWQHMQEPESLLFLTVTAQVTSSFQDQWLCHSLLEVKTV